MVNSFSFMDIGIAKDEFKGCVSQHFLQSCISVFSVNGDIAIGLGEVKGLTAYPLQSESVNNELTVPGILVLSVNIDMALGLCKVKGFIAYPSRLESVDNEVTLFFFPVFIVNNDMALGLFKVEKLTTYPS